MVNRTRVEGGSYSKHDRYCYICWGISVMFASGERFYMYGTRYTFQPIRLKNSFFFTPPGHDIYTRVSVFHAFSRKKGCLSVPITTWAMDSPRTTNKFSGVVTTCGEYIQDLFFCWGTRVFETTVCEQIRLKKIFIAGWLSWWWSVDLPQVAHLSLIHISSPRD